MILEKRFQELELDLSECPYNSMGEVMANQCVQICDEFAIAFYEWRSTSPIKNIDQYTNSELLEIYKQGL